MKENERSKQNRFIGVRGQRGSTLLFVIGMLAFTTLLSFELLQYLSMRNKMHAQENLMASRNRLTLKLRRNIRIGTTIWASVSAPGNQRLFDCAFSDPGQATWDCPNQDYSPVTFINDEGAKITGRSDTDPVLYNLNGDRCEGPALNTCVYGVWTEFAARCPNGWGSCSIAKGFDVRVHVITTGFGDTGLSRNEFNFMQYVPYLDWGYGQWALLAWDFTPTKDGSNIAPDPPDTGGKDPVASDGSGGGGGSAPSEEVIPAAPKPVLNISSETCGPGMYSKNGTCASFSF